MSAHPGGRVRIYQLMVRHFGNTNERRKPGGTLAENGCGKFADIGEAALASLRGMGFTHLWLTGVLEHASRTAYPGRPADDPAIVKGLAGSPYAIRDCFDVTPDCAVDPANRLGEFRELVDRCAQAGLRTLIDFVPNHVARSYCSDVRPELSFGARDDRGVFFARDNNFFYFGPGDPGGGPPLVLPGPDGCEGVAYGPEREWGRVSGNNVRSWRPSAHDWYETVKLNYGHDFTAGRDTSHLPGPEAPDAEVPDTWRKMDAVLRYWLELGVTGFRADMAHLVPREFWRWVIRRARGACAQAFFVAEAYNGDPARLTDGDAEEEMLESGFDAVYDSAAYDLTRGIYEGPKWANDLDGLARPGAGGRRRVRYAENHDEVRLANPRRWGGHGMAVGRPVSAILFGQGGGPVMLYNGQEVGEPALGASGFSGDDARTTIFDYWSLPELARWVNGHRYDGGRLSEAQRELRAWYGRLLRLCGEPAFAAGDFLPLNPANLGNPAYGRLAGEDVSGHWLYSFLRVQRGGGQVFLVAANLHGSETMRGAVVRFSREALGALGRLAGPGGGLRFEDRLGGGWSAVIGLKALDRDGLALPELPPCFAIYADVS